MKLVRGIYNIKKEHQGCVLTIGNFDSVHIGHQKLLKCLKNRSKKYKSKNMVMIFEPHPLEFFLNFKAPARLSRLRDKIKYIAKYNINYLLCIKFNNKIASLTKEKFVSKFLIKKLKIKALIIGEDFCFGRDRKGNLNYLMKISKKYNFKVIHIDNVYKIKKRVSSTLIRKALLNNNFFFAEKFMGHSYKLNGRVVYGRQIGSKIGFPTANILFKSLVIPLIGVYIVKVFYLKKELKAVANISKFFINNRFNQQIEVHLIDTYINLYKKNIDIVLIKKIRNEKKFSSFYDLKKKIHEDIIFAKKFFSYFV